MNNTIFVIRHGQTDWNLQDFFQGSSDIPLNNTGKQQALEAAKDLSGIKFDIVYSSPLIRARETCEIILNENGFGGIPVFEGRLRERNFGILEGTSIKKLKEAHPEGWWNVNKELFAEGMETIGEIFERIHGFLGELKAKHENKNILIVCHGAVMRAIYFYFNALPADGDLYKAFKAENASIYKYNL